jgi:ketosteroid isomerase-like protein
MTHSDSDEISIVRDAYTSWTERDLDALFANIHPEIVYVLHLDPAVFPLGGEHRGRDTFRKILEQLAATFAYLRFERSKYAQDGNIVRFRVDYTYLHKASRQILSSSYLAEVTVAGRQIVRIEEFPDAGFVEAFLRFNAAVARAGLEPKGA